MEECCRIGEENFWFLRTRAVVQASNILVGIIEDVLTVDGLFRLKMNEQVGDRVSWTKESSPRTPLANSHVLEF